MKAIRDDAVERGMGELFGRARLQVWGGLRAVSFDGYVLYSLGEKR